MLTLNVPCHGNACLRSGSLNAGPGPAPALLQLLADELSIPSVQIDCKQPVVTVIQHVGDHPVGIQLDPLGLGKGGTAADQAWHIDFLPSPLRILSQG